MGNIHEKNFLFEAIDSKTIFSHFSEFSGSEKFQLVLVMLLFFTILIVLLHKVVFLCIRSIYRKENRKELLKKLFRGFAITILLLGWLVYWVGFCEGGTADSILAIAIRSFISSLEQFVFHSDLLEVSKVCHDSSWFMTLYTLTYFSAILISSIVIIDCIKDRAAFLIKHLLWSIFKCREIHVFFGVNNKSLILAKSLWNEYNKTQEGITSVHKNRIVIVSFPNEYEETHSHTSLSKIFKLKSLNQEKVQIIRDVNGMVLNASSDIFDDAGEKVMSPYVLEYNGLEKLISIIKNARKVSLYFLSDNDNKNIRAGINIERSHVLQKKEVDIYCKARNSYENYVLIDNSRNAMFHLVDDSSLAIRSLMTMRNQSGIPIAHPINYVSINNSIGVVESKFTCLIVGFGQTGQDAMKFLYEYGSFVDGEGNKSPFYCRVVDKNMDQYLGYVASEIPALQIEDDTSVPIPITKKEIELKTCDVHSLQFWKDLEKIDIRTGKSFIEEINCVVVAIGTDEENISLATQLYEFAIRHNAVGNKSRECLKIFVRAYDIEEGERVSMVEKYYNKDNDVIRVFGKISEIYSYDNIVRNELKEKSKEYFKSYNSVIGDNADWDERHNKLREGSMTIRNEVRIKETQDASNVLHQYTKIQLLGLSPLSIRNLPVDYPFISNEELERICNGNFGTMSEEDKDIKQWYARLQNVSRCEHLRWNAAMYMLGFVRKGTNKDFRLRQHKCLVAWDETDKNGSVLLTDAVKKYDYKVVETTILLYQKENASNNNHE